ncbi:MAG: TolC family protein [Thermodesulfobacteriota bacterium]
MNATTLRQSLTLFLLILLGVPNPLRAEDRPLMGMAAGVQVLTLEQALAIADDQNRNIQKAREYSRWVYGKYLEERAQALPQLTLVGTQRRDRSRQDQDGPVSLSPAFLFVPGITRTTTDTTGLGLNLTQPLFTWGKVSAAVRAAKVALSSADQQLRLFRQATRRDVTSAFHDILLAKELHAIALQTLDQRERHLDEARKKFSLGTATDYDVLAADVAVKNARPEVIRSANSIRLTRERLQFLLGKDAGQVDVVGDLRAFPAPVPEYDALLAVALRHRPEILNQEITLAIQEELVTIAKAGDKPTLSFSGSYGRTFSSTDVSFSSSYGSFTSTEPYDNDSTDWAAGLILSFPLFDGFRTRGQVAQAKSNLESGRIDMGRLKESISIEAQMALDQVHEAMEILKALEGTAQQAQRLLTMAEKGFEYGVKTRLDVDDAQLNLSAARGNLARASRDYLVALTNLRWVQGILGEE